MSKLYFLKGDDEICYDLGHWRDYIAENKLKEIELIEAERETGTGYFWCKKFQEVGEKNEGCGRFCDEYKPNNGKNGRCKHYGYTYSPTDKKLTLKS